MTARYAIYYAPPPDTPIWSFGSRVLGYDAERRIDVTGFALPGWDPGAWRALTERPRLYGFHATLKAPFSLDAGTEDELREALAQFSAGRAPFRLGPMAVTAIIEPDRTEGFVALTPTAPPPALAALERDVVIGFDRFRRPLTDTERLRRNPDRLSPRQQAHLDRYGYPFVLDEFRFHMTLTGATAQAPRIADDLADVMAGSIGTVDLTIDALCLFRQERPGAQFAIIGRYPLAGG
jgi:2'-5' RNA ligase